MSLEVGQIVSGKVSGITKFGAFVDMGEGNTGMIHVSEISTTYTQDINEAVKLGDEVRAKIVGINDGKISLSIKRLVFDEENERRIQNARLAKQKSQVPLTEFEIMLNKFKQNSEDKFSDLKKATKARRGRGRHTR